MSSPFAEWSDASTRGLPLDVELRPAKPSDQSQIDEIQIASARRTVAMERLLVDPDRTALVAEHDGRIVGWAATQLFHDADGPAAAGYYLTGVTVLPSARGRGVGLALTQARLAWIWDRAEFAWYFANSSNVVSIALHSRFGFEQVAEVTRVRGVGFQDDVGLVFRAPRPR